MKIERVAPSSFDEEALAALLIDAVADGASVGFLAPLVLREQRGRGVGEALMRAIEDEARRLGRWLLVLDTATSAAERLYRRLGYQRAGAIPGFAESSRGDYDATVLYYKRLRNDSATGGTKP